MSDERRIEMLLLVVLAQVTSGPLSLLWSVLAVLTSINMTVGWVNERLAAKR